MYNSDNKNLGITVTRLNLGIKETIRSLGFGFKEGSFPVYVSMEYPWLYGDLTVMLYGDDTEITTYA